MYSTDDLKTTIDVVKKEWDSALEQSKKYEEAHKLLTAELKKKEKP